MFDFIDFLEFAFDAAYQVVAPASLRQSQGKIAPCNLGPAAPYIIESAGPRRKTEVINRNAKHSAAIKCVVEGPGRVGDRRDRRELRTRERQRWRCTRQTG